MNASHTSRVSRRNRAVALIAGLLAFAAVASAQEAPSAVVRYSAADVQSPAGADQVYARIRAAARQVCAPFDGPTLKDWSASRACQDRAIEQAVNAVHSSRLAALYRHNGIHHG